MCGVVQNSPLPYKPKIKTTSRGGITASQSPMLAVNHASGRQPSPVPTRVTSQSQHDVMMQHGASPQHGPSKKRSSVGDSSDLTMRCVFHTGPHSGGPPFRGSGLGLGLAHLRNGGPESCFLLVTDVSDVFDEDSMTTATLV